MWPVITLSEVVSSPSIATCGCLFSDVIRQVLHICRAKTVLELLAGCSDEPHPPITSPYTPLSSSEWVESTLLDSGADEGESAESEAVENLASADCCASEPGLEDPEETRKMVRYPDFCTLASRNALCILDCRG